MALAKSFTTALCLLFVYVLSAAAQITPPDKFFGFQLGADRKMARWDKIVEYFQLMEKESGGRMKVINMGPTSMGNPFLMAIITSPANMAKLDRLKQINAQISDSRGITEAEIKKLVAEGKPIVVQSMSLHATEIGGSQMAPELVYDELSRKDEEAQRILDNVISIVVPSFNPDGQIMVTDWYRKYVDTEYEGSNPPWLYHKYAGHDNNRDAFQTNMVESQYMAKILFTEWKPEAYVDHHGMGPYGARIFLPPYAEPVRPMADPLIWRELSWYRRAHGLQGRRRGAFRRVQHGRIFRLGALRLPLDYAVPQHCGHADGIRRGATGVAACFCIRSNCRAACATCRSTKKRRCSRIRGRAGGGGCATLWSGRRYRPGPRSI